MWLADAPQGVPAHQHVDTRATPLAEIAEVVARWTGIPVSKMLEGERDKLLKMEDALHDRVVGQEEAIKVDGATC